MAKLKTHYIFSMGIVALLLAYLKVNLTLLISGLLTAFLTDTAIDLFGHRKKRGNPHLKKRYIYVRSRLTHSILTAPMWGIAVGYLVSFVLTTSTMLLVTAGFTASICHLFADSLTEAGIYFPFKRQALLRLPYNHIGINSLLILLGVIGLICAVLLRK